MSSSFEIHKMTYKKVKEKIAEGYTRLILPVGTMEAHGPHLPLGTDTFIPYEIAKVIAPKLKALVAPPIHYGVTRSLLDYEGSSTVSEVTLKNVLVEVILSFRRHGFSTFIILNGHGGNTGAVKDALFSLWSEHKVRSVSIDWWFFVSEVTKRVFGEVGAHAGVDETAMILATYPELVDTEVDFSGEVFLYRDGLVVYPFPGTIITYKDSEGVPKFDVERAREYFSAVTDFLAESLLEIVERIERKRF